MQKNNYPKLHNASWPGVVGKGPDSEPPISIDTMIDLTANAIVDGVKFDGFDLFLFDPHMDIDVSAEGIKKMADKAMAHEKIQVIWDTQVVEVLGDKEVTGVKHICSSCNNDNSNDYNNSYN